MGLDAQVIAVGPFSRSIISCLEYGDLYANVEPGTTVVTNVFLAGTSEASHGLAKTFGVGAMDLGRHHLDPASADTDLLRDHFGDVDVSDFERLVAHGFQFYFLPNG